MIITEHDGTEIVLLNEPPNWLRGYQTDFEVLRDDRESLTKRETRRPYGSTLRTSVKCVSTVADSALRTLLGRLRQLKAQPVVTPFYPAASFWSERGDAKIGGGLLVAFKRDWSQWEIYEAGDEPGWPAPGDSVSPLLWGFVKDNELKWLNVSTAHWPVDFTEASRHEFALTFEAGALQDGPTPAGYAVAPKIIPFRQDHRSASEQFTFSVKRDGVGMRREQVTTSYPHDVYVAQPAQYTIDSAESIAAFISWFEREGGRGSAFWAVSSFEAGRLALAAGAADVALTLEEENALQVGDHVCTYKGQTLVFAKVTALVDEALTISAGGFGVNLPQGQPLYRMTLARFSGTRLSLKWPSPVLALAKFRWSEVRPEILLPGGEVLGETIGRLPTRAVLFHFWRDYGNGTVEHWRFTSHEEDVQWNDQVWSVGPFECKDIIRTLNVEDDSTDVITSLVDDFGEVFDGNPVVAELLISSEAPLNVEIYFVDLDFDAEPLSLEAVATGGIEGVGGDTIEGL